MKAWLISNSSKRKTLKGMEKFINSWLSRQQDNSRNNSNNRTSGIDWNEWDKKNNNSSQLDSTEIDKLLQEGEIF